MIDKSLLAIFTIVAAVGLLGLVVVEGDTIVKQIQAFAKGCNNGVAFNASKGRCFGH
jgi:xanthosine utilization system XapX-like protein